jgi:acetyl-CoA carboxylase biotin carboxyl carrier protein
MLEDNIKSLIKILEDSSIDEMEVSTFWGKRRIRIRKNNIHQRNQDIEIIQDSQEQIKQNPIKQPHDLENKIISDTIKTEIQEEDNIYSDNENTIYIKSPLVGTFYRSLKPGDPPFISEGDLIKEGQVICIVEAMKIFNEIESEVSGRVKNILIKDSTPIEYDQNLISITPE